MMKFIRRIVGLESFSRINRIENEIVQLKIEIGRVLSKMNRDCDFRDCEFRVFSQFGDDGIIDFLTRKIPCIQKTFIEFGVEDYQEASTRFLLSTRNWRGFVMDGSEENIASLRSQDFFWKHDLNAKAAFVTRDNVNELIREGGLEGNIGLLHIDLDGNDYWIWKSLNCVDPAIVVLEYNSIFGDTATVTIPYAQDFDRTKSHFSNLYWGASLAALALLSNEKGYKLIGCNQAGNNAYFVKHEIEELGELGVAEAYVESRYRESRSPDGSLTFLSGKERLKAIGSMPLWDVVTRKEITCGDLC